MGMGYGFLKKKYLSNYENDLIVYTDHIIFEGESDIRRIPIKIIEGRLETVGMYYESDLVKNDDTKTNSIGTFKWDFKK